MIRHLALACALACLAGCASQPAPAPVPATATGGDIPAAPADPSVMTPHGY
ncbi:putative lipoprotein YajG [Endobacter medicaginis]|uniref:Putative lipoprotein YajG n=1 Tax=Endobacter medicaginis TaxID=1181271 RepID=A0A839UXK6_9PROT|nr:hypothetical protein [Endobacter medicaginis]MBB3175088.1 putative lipoprotein YajG [Endobacter medicaginis]MCX5476204.1 hypothetical protein [Endobacter medicaginis]